MRLCCESSTFRFAELVELLGVADRALALTDAGLDTVVFSPFAASASDRNLAILAQRPKSLGREVPPDGVSSCSPSSHQHVHL